VIFSQSATESEVDALSLVNSRIVNVMLATTESNAARFSDNFMKSRGIKMIPLKDFSLQKLLSISSFRTQRILFEFGPILSRNLILNPNDSSIETFILTVRMGKAKSSQLAEKLCNFKEIFENYDLKFRSEVIKGMNAEWNFYVFERRNKMTLFD